MTCRRRMVLTGSSIGVSITSSSSIGQPVWSPAWMASSTRAVPGTRTWPPTAWSASHGCSGRPTRPVSTTSSDCGVSTPAPSSGCGAGHRPAEGVVTQPRLQWQAHPAGEHHLVRLRCLHHGAKQWMLGRGQAQAGGIGRGGRLEPEVLVLEGGGGKWYRVPGGGDQLGPVDGYAADEQVGHGAEELGVAALVAAQRADDCGGAGLEGFFDGGDQDGVGAGFDEDTEALVAQFGDGGGEAHRLAQVGEPVAGVDRAGDPVVGHGGEPGDGGWRGADVSQGAGQGVLEGVDLGGVGGVVDGERAGAGAAGREGGLGLVQCVGGSGQHECGGAVDGGDFYLVAEGLEDMAGVGFGGGDGEHGAVAGQAGGGGPAGCGGGGGGGGRGGGG